MSMLCYDQFEQDERMMFEETNKTWFKMYLLLQQWSVQLQRDNSRGEVEEALIPYIKL